MPGSGFSWRWYVASCTVLLVGFFDSAKEGGPMIVTTGNDVVGYVISEYLGIVRGIVVRSPSISQGLLGGLK